MLSLKWLACISVAAGLAAVAFAGFAAKTTPATVVLAKDTVISLPSQPGTLKGINPQLIAQKQPKVALVIGNANYDEDRLSNPVNDATDIAKALKELGFEVTLVQNLDLRSMEAAIEDFSRQLRKGGVGVFYYAGHGVQVEGENYLIPLKAKLLNEKDARYEAVALGKVINTMEAAENQVNIIIIDACRDNPFYRRWRSSRRSSNVRGLTAVSPPNGIIIAYATREGNTAADGVGQRNSPFTSALLENIKKPNIDVQLMFRRVSTAVKQKTNSAQQPWTEGNLEGDEFYLNPQPVAVSPVPSPSPSIPTSTPNPTPVTTPQPSPSPQLTAMAFFERGLTKEKAGDSKGAFENYDQSIKLDPNFANAYYGRGIAKSNLGDKQGAIIDYNQAIKLNSDYANAYNGRGNAKSDLGDNQGAIADYNQAIKLKPDYADAYYNRGLIYKESKDNQNATKDFRQAAKLYQQQNNPTWYQNSLDRLQELIAAVPMPKPTPSPVLSQPGTTLISRSTGVNYTNLRDLLAAGKWKEADAETSRAMLQAAKREEEGWFRYEDIDNFSCEDLRIIDQLWVSASQGKFGFSVQKEIYESLGGTREYNEEVWNKFGDRVGWRKGGSWLYYSDLTFRREAPKAHLPCWAGRAIVGGFSVDVWIYSLDIKGRGYAVYFSRAKACNL